MRGRKGARRQPPAFTALPALKPNQPTQSNPVPMRLSTTLCGGIGSLREAQTLAQHQSANQRGNPRADMHHRSAGEIEHGILPPERPVEETAFAPNHMGQRKIDDRYPKQGKYKIGAEFHPLGHRAANERRRDDGKHHLEQHKTLGRDGWRIGRVGAAATPRSRKCCSGLPKNAFPSPKAIL